MADCFLPDVVWGRHDATDPHESRLLTDSFAVVERDVQAPGAIGQAA